jgi:small subunit ribosomal protein S1
MQPGSDTPATSTSPTPPTAPTAEPAAKSAAEFTAEMNAEIDAAMKAMDAEGMGVPGGGAAVAAKTTVKPSAPAAIRGPRVVQAGREHRTGTVVTVGPTDIFIEFGPKELGILPRAQFPEDQLPEKNSRLEVVIDKFEASEGIFVCSRPGAVQKAAWEMLEPGTVVEALVTGVATKDNKQVGLELTVANHHAFMPAGQVALDRVPDFNVFVGEKLKCTVTRVDRFGKGNIVLSRREILEVERKENAAKIKASLAEGQTLEGTVRKIMPFGAFVDIGGVDGLVHISDLSYDRIGFGEKAVEKHIKEGQRVTVRVLKIDHENDRISLGIKQVMGDPFAQAANSITEGAEVTGKVTKIADFGAFCEIAPGVEGLIHISELDHKRVGKVEDVLKPDEVVQVKILKIDQANRRVSLSIKALKPMPEAPAPSEGGGPGGPGGGKGGKGGFGGRGGMKDKFGGKTAEEILKVTPELRRLREKFKKAQFKGGLS